ncbi:hypothetical protein [Cupriavidus basilensis]|uniref:hypothetical protein n=1 Tax=Cupriavidus basilensis TaxID=68895 RepID=UPI0023E8AA4D|nr:hypothetical protein [Cupriavidus basilensis]MDF3883056.1 hypothetical protein [Cupriavidus basilensis]
MTVTVAAVARDVNISPALIHNRYPEIAQEIRNLSGKSEKNKSENQLEQYRQLEVRLAEIKAERDELRRDVAKLASLNLALKLENESVRAAMASSNVTYIRR